MKYFILIVLALLLSGCSPEFYEGMSQAFGDYDMSGFRGSSHGSGYIFTPSAPVYYTY